VSFLGRWIYLVAVCGYCQLIMADITHVYHPYIEQNEREIEYGSTLRNVGDHSQQLENVGLGYAFSEHFFAEMYVLSESLDHDDDKVRGYELELKWQLTEQGEYSADWGFMLESGATSDWRSDEIAAGVLWEKELTGRWVGTMNGFLEYEYGSEIDNEFETAFRGQLRYRWTQAVEPALEMYLDDKDYAAGPVLTGVQRFGEGRRIKWEFGWLVGLDSVTPDNTLRGLLEYEF
jgi:hypothetical protein